MTSTDKIIQRCIDIAKEDLKVDFFDFGDENIFSYLKTILKAVRGQKFIPPSLLMERRELERRIAESEADICGVDGTDSNGGSFNSGLRPNTEEQKHIKRLELKERLILVESKIRKYDRYNDDVIRDSFKYLIELIPNEIQRDVVMQFYIYRNTITDISLNTFFSYKSCQKYMDRGIEKLSKILSDFIQKDKKG